MARMRIGFLITARLKSARLPLKLLKDLNGYSLIERVIQRAKRVVECHDVVLCTSTLNQDLPLVRIAQAEGISYFNGSSDDVLMRLMEAAGLFGFDHFLGTTADNPLFSIYHANILSGLLGPDLDFVFTADMPIGVNVYAINVKALRTVCEVKETKNTEIWGYWLNRPDVFNVRQVPVGEEYKRPYRLTLDEPADYELFAKLYDRFDKDVILDVAEAFRTLDADPKLAATNRAVVQRDLDEAMKQEIDLVYATRHDEILEVKRRIYGPGS